MNLFMTQRLFSGNVSHRFLENVHPSWLRLKPYR